MIKNYITTNNLFWVIYSGLLGVMLPHNAWTAQQFFNDTITGWAFAIVFEGAILAFTIQLKEQIVKSSRLRKGTWLTLPWRRFKKSYVNIYTIGLVICCFISGLANFSYVVEFSESVKAVSDYEIPILIYQISFGAALPLISILFARVLASLNEFQGGEEKDAGTEKLELELKNLRDSLKNKNAEILQLNNNISGLEQQLKHFEIFQKMLNGQTKEEKMQAVVSIWPDMPKSGIASILGVSPSIITEMTRKREEFDF